MLEAMIEDDDLSKKDMEWIKLVLNNDKFAKTKTDKAIKVTHGLTADEPGSGPKVTKPPISTFKVPPIAKGFKPTTQAEAKANADFPDDPEDVEETRQAMDLEKQKEGTYQMGKLVPKDSPSDKMNVMNNVNTENQTLQQGQSGSQTIINNTNAQATTTNSTGGIFTLPNPVHSPRLTTSLTKN